MSLPKVRNSYALVLALAAVFGLQFIWFEWVIPSSNAASCSWAKTGVDKQSNVLLVADPQLIDNHTYPGRNGALLRLSQHTVDKYIKQNYKAMVSHLQPDYIFFLGDYLDNGRSASDAYFAKESRRFWRIFNRWPAQYQQGVNWFTNLPGNHDIGFGDGVKEHSRERFENTFGKSNVVVEAGGVDFVIVDTPSYSAGNELNQEAKAFVDSISVEEEVNDSKGSQEGAAKEEASSAAPQESKEGGYIDSVESRSIKKRSSDEEPAPGAVIDPGAAIAADEGSAGFSKTGADAEGAAPAEGEPKIALPSSAPIEDMKESDLKNYLNAPKGKDEKAPQAVKGSSSHKNNGAPAAKGSSVSKQAPGTVADPSVVKHVLPEDGRKPRVLLTHVPLFRDVEALKCGPLRESSVFHTNAGYQYQSALSPDVSTDLLQKVRPIIAFSGDDHDYCDVTHPLTNTREITVKSISMAMGVWRPAVQLLSFGSPDSKVLNYETHMCYLPKPYHNVIVYAFTAAIMGGILLLHSLRLRPVRYNYTILPTHGSEYESSAILSENPMSKKLSNFLKEQDEGSSLTSTPLPAYTSTSSKSRLDSVSANYKYARLTVRRFARKYNLAFFLRLCLLQFCSVMVAYFLVVAAI